MKSIVDTDKEWIHDLVRKKQTLNLKKCTIKRVFEISLEKIVNDIEEYICMLKNSMYLIISNFYLVMCAIESIL